jgi:hypothetical protein
MDYVLENIENGGQCSLDYLDAYRFAEPFHAWKLSSLVDLDNLVGLSYACQNLTLYKKLLKDYLTKLQNEYSQILFKLGSLNSYSDGHTWKMVRHEIHKMKGESKVLGFMRIGYVLDVVDYGLSKGFLSGSWIRLLADTVDSAANSLIIFLKQESNSADSLMEKKVGLIDKLNLLTDKINSHILLCCSDYDGIRSRLPVELHATWDGVRHKIEFAMISYQFEKARLFLEQFIVENNSVIEGSADA